MKYAISVIIPVYNVEKYIAECLDSVIQQSIGIENIEVILIDDGSTDRSMQIAAEYAAKYPSINIFQHEGKGPGAARNAGFQHVSAEYFTFLDADDFVSLNTYEHALHVFSEFQCDMVLYEYEYYSKSGRQYPRNPSGNLFEANRLITDLKTVPEIIFAMSMCNKVFPRKFLDKIRFPDTKFEDILVSTQLTLLSKRIYITNECKYYYRKREDEREASRTDTYLDHKENYYDHFEINENMLHLSREYPDYKELFDWFNARSMAPFIYHMFRKKMFTAEEREELFEKAHRILLDVSPEALARLENPLTQFVVRKVQSGERRFFLFQTKLYQLGLKAKRVFSKLGKTRKLFSVAPAITLSLLSRIHPKYRNVWLICERGHDAKDNGFVFFQYIRKYHPEIPAYYLIDRKNEKAYEKVKSLGHAVPYMSLKHKMLFVSASKLISAHKGTIEPWNYALYKKYLGFLSPHQQYIFLQHGITKDDVSYALGRENTFFDLFITGARPEHEFILKHFGYREDQVAYTGFARFDHLIPEMGKNQILFMPTWRKGIMNTSWNKTEYIEDQIFLQSEYFKRLQSLLLNEELINLLEWYDYDLIFYPHDETQPYLKYFKSNSTRVKMATVDDYDIQALLKESKLLITDYSSVFFDFGYMEKPMIYYQFDKGYYLENHYKKGYFDYEEHGFGPVATVEQEVIDYIRSYFEKNFRVEDWYKERIDRFFEWKDQQNCERIYKAIRRLENHGV